MAGILKVHFCARLGDPPLPDVLAVVVGAEHVELDVDRAARVAVLCHDGVGAHLEAKDWLNRQDSDVTVQHRL